MLQSYQFCGSTAMWSQRRSHTSLRRTYLKQISDAELHDALLAMDQQGQTLSSDPLVELIYYKLCSEWSRERKALHSLSLPELRMRAIEQVNAHVSPGTLLLHVLVLAAFLQFLFFVYRTRE